MSRLHFHYSLWLNEMRKGKLREKKSIFFHSPRSYFAIILMLDRDGRDRADHKKSPIRSTTNQTITRNGWRQQRLRNSFFGWLECFGFGFVRVESSRSKNLQCNVRWRYLIENISLIITVTIKHQFVSRQKLSIGFHVLSQQCFHRRIAARFCVEWLKHKKRSHR